MRSEQEIFEELSALCTSPGYVHAIAFLCFKNNFVRFADELSAKEVSHIFSKSHLIRRELSTLIGLFIKGDRDKELPEPKVLQGYVDKTESLLEQMHRAIEYGIWGGVDFEQITRKSLNIFGQGRALKEPIFYTGESAYAFQYRDLAVMKYHADNQWLESNKGFSIDVARDVALCVMQLQNEKLASVAHELSQLPLEQWTLLPGFSFTSSEISERSGLDQSIVEKVLSAFTLSEHEKNATFSSIHDFNAMTAAPLLLYKDCAYVLLEQYSLVEALYDAPFYWMGSDKSYADEAFNNRGRFTEEFSRQRLALVFGEENVHANVDIYQSKKKKAGEIDVLAFYGNRAIVLQAKSKRLTLEARKGNDGKLREDFKKSVQDSFDQAYRCAQLLNDPRYTLIDTQSQAISVPKNLKEIFILCVISDHYPALSFQVRQFLKSQTSELIKSPLVLDVFALDTLTEMLEKPLHLLSYVRRRSAYWHKLYAPDELTILSYHLRQNLWFDEKHDVYMIDDSVSVSLDLAMLARREGIPGERTPKGILTRYEGTTFWRMIREIESNSDPVMIDLGYMLLSMSEESILELSKGTDEILSQTQKDSTNHTLLVGFTDDKWGLTFHCNSDSLSIAHPRLEAHCKKRKYTQKAHKWFGICLNPEGVPLVRFAICLDYEWEPGAEMEAATTNLKPIVKSVSLSRRSRRKIGPNDPCPCGSGKKYKKCHLRYD